MKTRQLLTFILCIGLFQACKKDETTVNTVTEEDAAEAITEAVSATSGGLTLQMTEAAHMATIYSTNCNVSKDSSITHTTTDFSSIVSWEWLLTCSETPHFSFDMSGHRTYDLPRMSSDDTLSASIDLTETANAFALSLDLNREGTQVSKVRNRNTFSSTILINGEEITVDKSTYQILSGTLSVSISGASSNGNSFSYTGTLVFNGGQTATLTLKSGNTYTIAW